MTTRFLSAAGVALLAVAGVHAQQKTNPVRPTLPYYYGQQRNTPQPVRPTVSPQPRPNPRPPNRVNPGGSPLDSQPDQPMDVPDWKRVAPDGAGFAVYMPDEPKEEKQQIRSGGGTLELTKHVVSLDDDGAYVVMYSDLPAGRTAEADRLFQAARDRVVQSLRGELLGDSRVQLGDLAGREIQVQAARGILIRQRMFVSGNRLYQVIAAGPRMFTNSPDVGNYLRSFRLVSGEGSPATAGEDGAGSRTP
jgi:hypothetical protein